MHVRGSFPCPAPGGYDGPHDKRPVSDLPDLTEALIEQGIYAEYSSWRDSYFKWRRGEARGAKGENSHKEHVERKQDMAFEFWYPNVSAFTFRRTCSYWVGALFVEGSLIFMCSPLFSMFLTEGTTSPEMRYALTSFLEFAGGVIFTIGCYMGYWELINMNVDVENGDAIRYLWCDWRDLRESLGLPWSSIVGWITYMVGGLLFQLSVTTACFTLDSASHELLVMWPARLGGFCFLAGGLCEVSQNRVFSTAPTSLVWWVSSINALGGFLFTVLPWPSLIGSTVATEVLALVGAACFVVSSLLVLLMWRGEQFGLALISVLNAVQRDRGTKIAVRRDLRTGQEHSVVCGVGGDHNMEDLKDVVEPQLSWRGILFVTLYAACGALQVMICCASFALYLASDTDRLQKHHLATFLQGLGNFVAVHMVLALCSACVRVPKEQPYRALVFMLRAMVFIILVNSVLTMDLGFQDDAAALLVATPVAR